MAVQINAVIVIIKPESGVKTSEK